MKNTDSIRHSKEDVYLIFSGHNDRAVVALCRYFHRNKIPFIIASSAKENQIISSNWADHAIYKRRSNEVNTEMFSELFQAYAESSHFSGKLIYCPTTEFINNYVLEYRNELTDIGYKVHMPTANIYASLTNKSSSSEMALALIGINSPLRLDWNDSFVPCVVKPNENIRESVVYYPEICLTNKEWQLVSNEKNSKEWFKQAYVTGQSYYLCGYLDANGNRNFFWQTNLLQQANGKSIVLARTGHNPGVDEDRLFDGLFKKGFYGPIMMEVIKDKLGDIYFIEFNPRFWGPLQLALDACPQLLDRYVEDTSGRKMSTQKQQFTDQISWYAWEEGASTPNCHRYPELGAINKKELNSLLKTYDVYSRKE